MQGHAQQKFQAVHGQHQMQYSQPLAHQQFQSRQLQPGHIQHNIGQNQMNPTNQLRSHLSQFAGTANNALFNAAQTSPNTQMFALSAGHSQRSHPSQILSDQMFNMGAVNPTNMVQMQQQHQQQQQHGTQGGFGNMSTNAQGLQSGMVAVQNTQQNPNYPQQRQQNQQ